MRQKSCLPSRMTLIAKGWGRAWPPWPWPAFDEVVFVRSRWRFRSMWERRRRTRSSVVSDDSTRSCRPSKRSRNNTGFVLQWVSKKRTSEYRKHWKSKQFSRYPSQDSSVGSISAWYQGGPGFKSRQRARIFQWKQVIELFKFDNLYIDHRR